MALNKLRLLLDWTLDAKHALFVEAGKRGFYREQGIELEIMEPAQKSSMALERLHAGEADLVINYPHNIILMQEKVPGVISVGSLVRTNPEGLLSLRLKNIESPKDLPGKTIGVGPSPVSQAQLEVFLSQNGIDRKSVNFTTVGFEGEELLLAGKIDLLDAVSYAIPRTLRKGYPVNFFTYTEYGLPDSPFLVFAAREDWAEKNRDILKGFSAATRKGLERVEAWDISDWGEYVKGIPARDSDEEEFQVWERTLPLLGKEKLFYQSPAEVENLYKILKDKKILDKDYSLEKLFLNLLYL